MKIVPGASVFAADRSSGGRPAPLAVAIGNFDGVHRGHQALLAEARERATRRGGSSAVLTFTPHPARLFAPDRAPPLIMSLERRLQLCAEAGIDLAIVEPFTRAFASIEADAFVRQVLARDLAARDVVVGYDFSFGRGRTGDVHRLTELGAVHNIAVAVIPQIAIAGSACSSTRIRELVAAGRPADAAVLLGRPFEIEGRVVRGAGRGRQLGFPTANLAPEADLLPALGIYAARARLLDGPAAGARYAVALSVGRNPTFTSGTLGGSPQPPATSSGGQSPPPLTRFTSGTLGGSPQPPATSSGGQSPPPLTRFTSGTLGGSPQPPATSSGGQSPPPLTRFTSGTLGGSPQPPATSSGGQSPPPLTRFTSGTLGGSPQPPATSSGGQSPPSLTRTAADATVAPVVVEAHLLDFDGDLYDRRLRIEVGRRLRDEQRFDSIAALVAQIEADIRRVREVKF